MKKIKLKDMKVGELYCMVGNEKGMNENRRWVIKVNKIMNSNININWWFLEGGYFNFKKNGIGENDLEKDFLKSDFDIFEMNEKEILKCTKAQILCSLK